MKKKLLNIEQLITYFSSSSSLMVLNNKLTEKLSNVILVIESSLFSLENNSIINYSDTFWLSEVFKEHIEYFEEQGIIKWVISTKEYKIIKNPKFDNSILNFFIIPIYLYDKPIAVHIFSSNASDKEFNSIKKDINLLSLIAGFIWINLKDREKIEYYEKKFENIENEIFNHSIIDSLMLQDRLPTVNN